MQLTKLFLFYLMPSWVIVIVELNNIGANRLFMALHPASRSIEEPQLDDLAGGYRQCRGDTP